MDACNGEHEMRKVRVEIRSVYGNDLIYPCNDEAKNFSRLVNKKTFSKEDLAIIKDLGFEIEVKPPHLDIASK